MRYPKLLRRRVLPMILAVSLLMTACSAGITGNSAAPSGAGSVSSRQTVQPGTLHSVWTETPSMNSSESSVSACLSVSSSASPSASVRQASVPAGSGIREVQEIRQDPETLKTATFGVSKSEPVSGSYTPVEQRAGYQYLSTDTERTLYSLIAQSVYQVGGQPSSKGYYPTGQIAVTGRLTEAQLRITLMAYLNDNPQVFWITNAYSYGFKGNETILQVYSFLSPSDCNTAIQEFNSRVQTVVQLLPQGLSESDREEILFDYLVGNCSYDDEAAANQSNWQAFTAYGTLMNGKAVCEGYSRAMQLLCSYAGLQCVLIRGTSDGVGHMWNGIRIDGNWYHLDITWCDSTVPIYNYYNVTDSIIRLTHVVGPAVSTLTQEQICADNTQYNITLPTCTSVEAGYFQEKGVKIPKNAAGGEDAVIKSIVPYLMEKKTTLAFKLDPSVDFDSAVNQLVSGKSYILYNYLLQASQSAGTPLDLQKTSYVTDKAEYGLNVRVFYR